VGKLTGVGLKDMSGLAMAERPRLERPL